MNTKLDQYIDGIQTLPPTPTLMVKLLALFREPDRDIDQVVELISHDPALTAEVLKNCNSAFYGSDQPVADLFEAVMRLGFYEVYRFVLAMLGSRAMSVPEAAAGIDVALLWEHSLATAVAAGVLARELGEAEGEAFTAGLLHDVGKIVLATREKGKYALLTQKAGGRGWGLVGAEKGFLGFDPAEIGAHLLARWGLPRNVNVAILHHHGLAGAEPFERLAAVVFLANEMARLAKSGTPVTPDAWQSSADAMALLQFTPDRVSTLMDQVHDGLRRFQI